MTHAWNTSPTNQFSSQRHHSSNRGLAKIPGGKKRPRRRKARGVLFCVLFLIDFAGMVRRTEDRSSAAA